MYPMSDAEVLVSSGQESENGEYILRRLPPWMPRSPDTGNFKLLDVVGRAVDRLDADLSDLDAATTVQHAETKDQLRELARLVELPPEKAEGREKYRTRVIAEYQTTTTEGTPRDVLQNVATLLDVAPKKIKYKNLDENGAVSIGIPGEALESLGLSDSEFMEVVAKHSAAGFRIDATVSGTYRHIGEAAYTGPYDSANGGYDPAQLDSDATKGHVGLDANGDPTGDGGTYSGIIE